MVAFGVVLISGYGAREPRDFPCVPGSVWVVTAIDGSLLAGDPVLLSFGPSSRAAVSGECGGSAGHVDADAGGTTIAFIGFGPPRGRVICAPERLAQFELVNGELESVYRWELDGNAAELHGSGVMRLELRDVLE